MQSFRTPFLTTSIRSLIVLASLPLQLLIPANACAQETTPRFRKHVLDDKISIGYGIAIGDVDGDKKPDIILADKKQIVWYRNGDWKKILIAGNLTENDNVCVAAADVDGDGKVEIAVGAQWNPGETTDDSKSGAVFYLKRPADITGLWKPVKLHHEPTVHRMKWLKAADGKFYLVVAPLHGRGNKQGEGKGVKILAYQFSKEESENWPLTILDSTLHLTHNFAIDSEKAGTAGGILVASKEGIKYFNTSGTGKNQNNMSPNKEGISGSLNGLNYSAGEISFGNRLSGKPFFATIEPMHGTSVAVYENLNNKNVRTILDSSLKEGHGLATADLLKLGTDQVVAGWRVPDSNGKTGLKIYVKRPDSPAWKSHWIDDGGIAVEDVQVADLNGDGKSDIIASGRATHNLVIYWNEL